MIPSKKHQADDFSTQADTEQNSESVDAKEDEGFLEFLEGWSSRKGRSETTRYERKHVMTQDGLQVTCVVVRGQPPYYVYTARIEREGDLVPPAARAFTFGRHGSAKEALEALWRQDRYPLAKGLKWFWLHLYALAQSSPPRVIMAASCSPGVRICMDRRLPLEVFQRVLSFLAFASKAAFLGEFASAYKDDFQVDDSSLSSESPRGGPSTTAQSCSDSSYSTSGNLF